MVPTYSPHCADSGGTLLLSSPTHSRLRQTDNTTSAIRSLRRSLSRSPSKPAFRFITSNSTSPSPKSPLSPSQPSPPPRPASASRFTSTTPSCSPSPLAIPFPPSSRINRTSARRSAVSRPSSRTRASPDSPAKRALSECRDNGNAIPASPSRMRFGVERRKNRSLSPATDHKHSREDTFEGIRHQHLLPYDKVDFGFGGSSSATASPLKRSDGIMNLDQASLGSPAAKRRSLHGPSHEADFNIFELGSATDWHDGSAGGASADENCADFEMSDTQETLNEGSTTPMPKRSSSLRKSTLSQRHNNERPTFARSRPNADLSAPKGRPRMSLDNYLAPMPRDSPFSSNGALPSSSLHPMAHPCGPPQHQPHPLSRTITQSSSGSSIVDDSPTHVPTHHPIRPRNRVDFSKSLPPGAFRPTSNSQVSQNSSAKEHPSDPSYATPDSHNFIRPYQPAFMSTGLISKRNRTLEDLTYGRAVSKAQMPDTPCKKSTIIFSDSPVHPGGTFGKPALAQPEFGTPSTPFSTHASKTIPGTFGKGLSIFGNSFLRSSLARRNSFVSVDCDEDHLLDGRADSQNSDYDLPPTPTKSGFGHVTDAVPGAATVPKDFGKRAFGDSGIAPSTSAFGFTSQTEQNSKFIQLESLHGSYERESDGMFDDSPTHLVKRLPYGSASAAHVRVCGLRRSHKSSASALSKSRLTSTSFFSTRTELVAKPSSSDPVSPVSKLDFSSRVSPHTPQESAVGTTGSIAIKSGQPAGQNTNIEHQASSSPSSFPPATPTAPRDYFQQNRPRRLSINPIAGFVPADSTLTSRFDKVELIGSGEFSHVYRVSKSAGLVPAVPIFSNSSPLATSGGSPVTSVVDRVYAIKMSRKPYTGMKDRERKRQEIVALKALGQGDHIVHYFDSWEEKNHLYIQTEFCEEGSLDLFLAQVGRKARLDDFRIWKVLLELALGVKHIHDHGFIHLDLKPANVLITFEGVLKIADFGMATKWPAAQNLEAEGDREYIAREVLGGRYDKPADIFALGLIMVEIAGNVELPDNGPSWHKLRNGDISDVPSLTWSTDSTIFRDSTGNPLEQQESFDTLYVSDSGEDDLAFLSQPKPKVRRDTSESGHPGLSRHGELVTPPNFMKDAQHGEALERVIKWMITPEPSERPIADEVLQTMGVRWAEDRRRAGATVFEGNWGPADDVLAIDTEMVDI